MKKIKIMPKEQKIAGKEVKPVEYFNQHKSSLMRIIYFVIFIALAVSAFFVWRNNNKINALNVFSEAKNLFYAGKYNISLTEYEKFVKEFPKHKLVPAAVLGAGYCYEETGNNSMAIEKYSKVKNEFSGSLWVDDAIKGIERLK